ncbi:MAG: hypothetical protein V7K41_24015 [Nostoc sp.]|uniref:hypothetical protein n=1 Tax=Nostoc sp. TaxID=1180 RepID=UPI002FF54A14
MISYIRIDGGWIDELCDAASNQDIDIKGLEQKQDSKPNDDKNNDTVDSFKNNQQTSQQQIDWYEEIRLWATELGTRPQFQ